jgi:hypothetical protein
MSGRIGPSDEVAVPTQTVPRSDQRRRASRIIGVLVLGAMLAGCDKCGDWWFSPIRGESQLCRDQAPKPQ